MPKKYLPFLLRVSNVLFAILLFAMPFAEWHFVVLPLRGKTFGFDFSGYRSASLFDLLFLLFMVSVFIEFLAQRRVRPRTRTVLLALIPLTILITVTAKYVPFDFPWLGASIERPLDVRSLLLHGTIFGVFAVFLSLRPAEYIFKFLKFAWVGYATMFCLLIYMTVSTVPLFQANYPFQPRFTLSFPFPVQNQTAPFISIVFLGLFAWVAQMAATQRSFWVYIYSLPLAGLVFACALTGSRSNLLLLFFTSLMFIGLACLRSLPVFKAGPIERYFSLKLVIVSLLCCAFVAIGVESNSDFQPILRSFSLFQNSLRDPRILIFGDPKGIRGMLWSKPDAVKTAEAPAAPPTASSAAAPAPTPAPAPMKARLRASIVRIENGCIVAASKPIRGLTSEQSYKFDLVLDRSQNSVALEVSTASGTIGWVDVGGLPRLFPQDVLVVGMDSDDTRRKSIDLTINPPLVEADGKISQIAFDAPAVQWSDRFYAARFGSPWGHLRSSKDRLSLALTSSDSIQTAVYATGFVRPETNAVKVTTQIQIGPIYNSLDTTELSFAFGLIDKNAQEPWHRLTNATLVRVAYEFSQTDKDYLHRVYDGTIDQYAYGLRPIPLEPDEVRSRLNDYFDCKDSKAFAFGNIEDWGSPTTYFLEQAKNRQSDIRAVTNYPNAQNLGKITTKTGDFLSLELPDTSVKQEYLAGSVGTMSAYRDILKYMGSVPLLAFLFCVFSLLGALAILLWLSRSHYLWNVALALSTQTVFLALFLYPQPFIFIKFYWVTFGLALGFAYRIFREANDESLLSQSKEDAQL